MCMSRTILSSISNHTVGKMKPFIFWKDLHQVLFYFLGFSVFGEAIFLGKANDMRINSNTFGQSMNISEDDVCGFSSDSWKFEKFLHCARNFSIIFFLKNFGSGKNIFGLCLVEANLFY